MEHRNGTRKPGTMFVTLRQGGVELGKFLVHNISSGGLAVTGNIARLPLHSLVTVQLHLTTTTDNANPQTRALVVHQNDLLTGLMWIEYSHLPTDTARAHAEASVTTPVFW